MTDGKQEGGGLKQSVVTLSVCLMEQFENLHVSFDQE